MEPYYLVLVNLSCLVYFFIVSAINSYSFHVLSIFFYSILMSFFITSRDFLHGDSFVYFNYYIGHSQSQKFEPAFETLKSIFLNFFPNEPVYFFFFISFLSVFILSYSIYKILPYKQALICIWMFSSFYSFYYFTFEVIRDGLGYSVLVYAFTFLIVRQDMKKYLFFVILASCIHYSNIIFLILPFFLRLRKKSFILFFFIFAYLLGNFLIDFLLGLDGTVFLLAKKLHAYRAFSSESKTILLRNLLFITLIPFVFKYSINRVYFITYIFFCFILILTLPFDEINRRFLFKGSLLLLIPLLVFALRYKAVVPFVFFVALYFNFILINYNAMYGLLNYQPFFEIKLEE